MKKFESPELEVTHVTIEDVITTSLENQLPPVVRP